MNEGVALLKNRRFIYRFELKAIPVNMSEVLLETAQAAARVKPFFTWSESVTSLLIDFEIKKNRTHNHDRAIARYGDCLSIAASLLYINAKEKIFLFTGRKALGVRPLKG